MKIFTIRAITVLLTLGLLLDLQSCRKKFNSTPEDMTDYGWTLYKQQDYLSSNDWFRQSIEKDPDWKDGYNGLGWTYGKLTVIDSSIYYFSQGLDKPQFQWDTTDTHAELLAGLTFSNRARGLHRNTIFNGDSLLLRTEPVLPSDPHWAFTHDSLLNYLDVRIAMASAYFSLGELDSMEIQIEFILDGLESSDTTVTDTSANGRKLRAEQLENLQVYLLTH